MLVFGLPPRNTISESDCPEFNFKGVPEKLTFSTVWQSPLLKEALVPAGGSRFESRKPEERRHFPSFPGMARHWRGAA